jgi:hypothetical protein
VDAVGSTAEYGVLRCWLDVPSNHLYVRRLVPEAPTQPTPSPAFPTAPSKPCPAPAFEDSILEPGSTPLQRVPPSLNVLETVVCIQQLGWPSSDVSSAYRRQAPPVRALHAVGATTHAMVRVVVAVAEAVAVAVGEALTVSLWVVVPVALCVVVAVQL